MRNGFGPLALSLAVVAVAAGCGGQHQAALGNVSGSLVRVGGPPPGSAVPLPGQVIAVSSGGSRYAVAAGEKGRFGFWMPPGVYRLTGRSPLINDARQPCTAAHAVRVTAGTATTGLDVVCSIR